MILRKSAEGHGRIRDAGVEPVNFIANSIFGWSGTLRTQISVLTGILIAATISVVTLVIYWAAFGAMTANVDNELDIKADIFLAQTEPRDAQEWVRHDLHFLKIYNPYISAAYAPAGSSVFVGDAIPVDRPAPGESSLRSVEGKRVLVKRDLEGNTVAVSKSIDAQHRLFGSLGATTLVIIGLGALMAWAVGDVVAAAGMRPITRLRRAVEYVRRTQDFRQLRVEGDNELAHLSTAFNEMMESLEDSRMRQAQLVADAGHELKTPLTSMRTNIELLMLMYRSGQHGKISPEDRRDLERDVLAQMEEMSTLIGDLVDLAREDSSHTEFEEIRLDHVVAEAVERVRRRCTDVTFQFTADPWVMMGDRLAMGRAPVNIIDNAAKWSPSGGIVRISLKAATRKAVLIVDDSGPGIPEEEREKVLERFYRATEARSMPGSGLGLAIARQVLARHGAEIFVEESDDGGARMRLVFPGWRPRESAKKPQAIAHS